MTDFCIDAILATIHPISTIFLWPLAIAVPRAPADLCTSTTRRLHSRKGRVERKGSFEKAPFLQSLGLDGHYNLKARFCCKFAADATTVDLRLNCLLRLAAALGAGSLHIHRWARRFAGVIRGVARVPFGRVGRCTASICSKPRWRSPAIQFSLTPR